MDKINLNPCEGLKSKNFNTNVDALKNKIIGLDKFWDMIDEMLAKDCHVQLVLPLVLSRYGIYGKNAWDLLNLKYSQINEKEKIVTLYYEDGNFKASILVDKKFINIINKSKIENVVNSIYRGIYLDTGYVIRKSSLANENSGNTEIIPGLVRRVNLAYGYVKDYPIIKFNNLVKSRKLDFFTKY